MALWQMCIVEYIEFRKEDKIEFILSFYAFDECVLMKNENCITTFCNNIYR